MVGNHVSYYPRNDMPGMKADSKGFTSFRLAGTVPLKPNARIAQLSGSLKAPLFFAVLATVLAADNPARAQLVAEHVSVTVIASGGFCDIKPDERVVAPNVDGGQVERSHQALDYVVTGDRFLHSATWALARGSGLRDMVPA